MGVSRGYKLATVRLATLEAVPLAAMADKWQAHPTRTDQTLALVPGVEHMWPESAVPLHACGFAFGIRSKSVLIILIFDDMGQEGHDVSGIHRACRQGHQRWQILWSEDAYAMMHNLLPRGDAGTVPPRSAARSTTTPPGRIAVTMSSVTSKGARTPGTCATVMTTSALAR